MSAIAKYLEAVEKATDFRHGDSLERFLIAEADMREITRAAMDAADEVRELVRAASVLYQCMGVLAEDHPKRELLLDTLAWMQGTRDEKPDFDALLPFDVEEPR